MTKNQKAFDRFVERNPHNHTGAFRRPDLTRRGFFQIAAGVGSALTGSFLMAPDAKGADITASGVTTINKAENVIFILLTGAPSHTDTFDLKVIDGTTPTNFTPEMVNGVLWPTGLLPNMAKQLPNMAVVRSVQSWALVHSLAQTWTQIGRNPAAALGDIAPNIGSVVAIEKGKDGTIFPPFVGLNATSGAGEGYFSSKYAPFRVSYAGGNASAGIPNTSNSLGQTRYNSMFTQSGQIDGALRQTQTPYTDYDSFYSAANRMMYNSSVNQAFGYSAAESAAYGASGFGDACLVAHKILKGNLGTRFVQINFGSWDHHVDIYAPQNLPTMAKQLDQGYAQLLTSLKADGLLDKTLVVVAGEFGRTVGPLTGSAGRDHWKQQSILFAGAGVKGGRALGATDATGAYTTDFGWSGQRYIKPEDVEATIYSAMGIDWTTVRYDDPFGRGFEYVPFSGQGLYMPINDLWS